MTDPNFFYSAKEYTLQEFLQEYTSKLPVIIEVTEGYLGLIELHTFSSDQVFFVHNIKNQKRVLCQDRFKRHISIPASYSIRFMVKRHRDRKGKELHKQSRGLQHLKDIVSMWKKGHHLHILVEQTAGLNFCINADLENQTTLGELQVLDIYDEHYLVGNSIIDDELYKKAVLIPAYVEIRVGVATGLDREKTKFPLKWPDLIKSFSHIVQQVQIDKLECNSEIIELPANLEEADESDYEFIRPEHFIYSTLTKYRLSNLYEYPGKLPPPVPQKSPKRKQKMPIQFKQFKPPAPLPEMETSTAHAPKQLPPGTSAEGERYSVSPQESLATVLQSSLSLDSSVASRIKVLSPKLHHRRLLEEEQDQNKSEINKVDKEKTTAVAGATDQPSVIQKQIATVPPLLRIDETLHEDEDEDIYQQLKLIPPDMSKMTVSELADVLRMLGMPTQAKAFLEAHVDGEFFMELGDNILEKKFHFDSFELVKLRKFQTGWRPSR